MQNSLQGTLPEQIALLSSLGFFQVSQNGISGMVPLSIYNISSLYYFNVVQNNLQGKLPPDVGHTLPNLEIFAGGLNNFTGPIPVSLSNATGLMLVDFAQNSLTGTLPRSLGILQEIVDRSLLLEEDEEEEVDHDNQDGRMEERAIINDGDPQSSNARSTGMVLDCMVSVLRIGLSCSDSLPSERIPMDIVAKKMHAIRDSFLRFKKRNRR
ncbi:hypothetical protein RHSIM_Rhsim05G0211000 [Rhododendron simsii]|uniref:Uncharacterized protein n=1 Tax=Rhododendron simsii TaxID=118357 RepID=A0A834LL93_RHOSS|nr:hypothetical protein RHSIM_Rhsim05G0211000 [Rhododendron simsii]